MHCRSLPTFACISGLKCIIDNLKKYNRQAQGASKTVHANVAEALGYHSISAAIARALLPVRTST